MSEKKQEIKLYPPGDKPVLLALTDGGHTFSVPVEGTVVPPRFMREALAKGCLPEGMQGQLPPKNKTEETRIEAVIKGIELLMAEVEKEPTLTARLLTGDGRPDATELSRRVGFNVPAALRDEAFDIFQSGGDD